jgi:chemotaxis signal transduction protein
MAAAPIIARLRDDKPLVETVFKSGKYVTFRVARQDFAMSILFVRGILPVHQMTASPAHAPGHEWICGFAAVSGRDFPVVDLRVRLAIPHGSHGREPFIIVVQYEGRLVGFIAERVSEVLELRTRDFRNGMVRTHGRTRRVLEPNQIMNEEDWLALGHTLRVNP